MKKKICHNALPYCLWRATPFTVSNWNNYYILILSIKVATLPDFSYAHISPCCWKTSEENLCHALIPHRSSGDGEDSLWGSIYIISTHVRAIWKDFSGKMNLSGKKKQQQTSGAVYEAQESTLQLNECLLLLYFHFFGSQVVLTFLFKSLPVFFILYFSFIQYSC